MSDLIKQEDLGRVKQTAECSFADPFPKDQIREGYAANLDLSNVRALYTLIRAVSADRLTLNYSYFPKSTLLDKSSSDVEPLGAHSYVAPYAKPMLTQHRSSDNYTAPADKPNGRVVYAAYKPIAPAKRVKSADERIPGYLTGSGYLRVLAAITDPDVIRAVLAGEYSSVSIGGRSKSVTDSISGIDILAAMRNGEDFDYHRPGSFYDNKLCYYSHSGLAFSELSWVNEPADTTAGVEELNLSENKIKMYLGEKKVGENAFNFYDFTTKQKVNFEGGYWANVELADSYNPMAGKTMFIGGFSEPQEDAPDEAAPDEAVVSEVAPKDLPVAEEVEEPVADTQEPAINVPELSESEAKAFFVWGTNPSKLPKVLQSLGGASTLLEAIKKVKQGAVTIMSKKTILDCFKEASKANLDEILKLQENLATLLGRDINEYFDAETLLVSENAGLDTEVLKEYVEKWSTAVESINADVMRVALADYFLDGNKVELSTEEITDKSVFELYQAHVNSDNSEADFKTPLLVIEGINYSLLNVDGFSDVELVEQTLDFYGVSEKEAPLQLLESLKEIALGNFKSDGEAAEITVEQFIKAHEDLQSIESLKMLVALARKTNTSYEELVEMSKPYDIFKEGALTLLLKQKTKEDVLDEPEVNESEDSNEGGEGTPAVEPLASLDESQAKPKVMSLVERKALQRKFRRG